MPKRRPGSFSEFSRNDIACARQNLAEVLLFRLAEKKPNRDQRNLWHTFGNLTIASAAMMEAYEGSVQLEASVAASLSDISKQPAREAEMVGKVLTRSAMRLIFSLSHIPDEAPEMLLSSRSRELDVREFLDQAMLLNPDNTPNDEFAGNGCEMFIGSYIRKLS